MSINYLNKSGLEHIGDLVKSAKTRNNYINTSNSEIFIDNTTENCPIITNKIKGNTIQNGTPTPSNPVNVDTATGLQEINVTGKNLFDKNTIITGKYIDNSGNLVTDSSNFVGDYIKIDGAKSYYVSQNVGGSIRIGYYDSLKNFISRELISTNYGSLTIPNNTEYVRLSCFNTSLSTLQLEIGTTSTEYEEYKNQKHELNLGKNLFDKDSVIENQNYLNKSSVSNLETTETGLKWLASSNDSYIGLPATITGGYDMYIKVAENTTYTLSFNSNYELTNYIFYIKEDYTFIQRNVPLGHNSGVSFTTPINCKYAFVRFGASNQNGNTINITNIQLERGTQATSYSEYFTPIELCKINNYQDYIRKSTGKNLFNKNSGIQQNKTYNSSGSIINLSNSFVQEDYIEVNKNTSYTLSTISNYTSLENFRFIICEYDNNYNFIKRNLGDSSTVTTSYSITTTPDTKYIRIGGLLTYINEFQLEKGTQATIYEPYGKVWYLHKEIGNVILDGSENDWATSSTNEFTTNSKTNFLPYSQGGKCLTNYYQYGIRTSGYCSWIGNTSFLTIKNVDYTMVTDFKNWLVENNTIVYYILATPSNEEIINEELISQLNELENMTTYNENTSLIISSNNIPAILDVDYEKNHFLNLYDKTYIISEIKELKDSISNIVDADEVSY